MEGNNTIRPLQVGLLIFITQTGVGIVTLPATLAKEAGHDGWISMLLTGLIVIILSFLIMLLMRRYSDKAIYDINKLIYGKFIGFAFNCLLVIYLLTATVAGASLFNNIIRITILQTTPPWVLAPFITLPSFYLVWQGLKSISRFLYLSMINYLIIPILIILLYDNFRVSFLLPLGEAGITPILYSIKTCFFAFIGFELIAFFYPWISEKNKVLKWYLIATLASTLIFVVVVAASIAVFGENLVKLFSIPFFNLSRIYNAPILERIDLYLIAIWYIPMACSIRSYIFTAFDGLQKVFKLKKNRVSYFLFFAAILILSSIPNDINQIFMIIDIINNAGMGISLFLVLCLVLSFIRKKGVLTR
ncbi:GerAB/ArcD/ProY family transporter [Pseudobacteroides cellulosolvens]|uniref:Spore germination protein n=1 Tax=Pseudobacteroides cellulosolvens ATCC 35603 = DSM 2933 TaxID=398512 RepID=A0A0L6JPC0_9FIRM|nr:GerAB/ArcD/ProY family transporter [Pseudobacteroides cellulosolvens]KNY27192.1 spore germination protein [Pseudobacteroides cellulosolvens ATCC 35603 = DSM 2933]